MNTTPSRMIMSRRLAIAIALLACNFRADGQSRQEEIEELQRQQQLNAEALGRANRQLQQLNENRLSPSDIADEIERRQRDREWMENIRKQVQERQRILKDEEEKARREIAEARRSAEFEAQAKRLGITVNQLFSSTRFDPKAETWQAGGGGVMKRGDKVVIVPSSTGTLRPEGGVIPVGVAKCDGGYIAKEGYCWVFPTRKNSLAVMRVDPDELTEDQWKAAVQASWNRVKARFPFLVTQSDSRGESWDRHVARAQNSIEYLVLMASSRWPELLADDLSKSTGWGR